MSLHNGLQCTQYWSHIRLEAVSSLPPPGHHPGDSRIELFFCGCTAKKLCMAVQAHLQLQAQLFRHKKGSVLACSWLLKLTDRACQELWRGEGMGRGEREWEREWEEERERRGKEGVNQQWALNEGSPLII